MSADINPFTKKPVFKEGRVIFMAGTTGTGKTTFTIENISKLPLPKYFFDIDGEFLKFGSQKVSREVNLEIQAEKFKQLVSPKWESVFVFSESGIFFQHGSNDIYMREILKSARRRGNWIFFDFHSLSEIPVFFLKFCNYLVIKKTVMETREQINKFKHYKPIMDAYKKVMESENNFETVLINPRTLNIEL